MLLGPPTRAGAPGAFPVSAEPRVPAGAALASLSNASANAAAPPPREGITWLIACHDCAPYITECIESLVAQTDPGWRALILDDASTDDSLERIRALPDPRIALITSDRNRGYIATLERLIASAETDIVGMLDADDALAPRATAALLNAYGRDPAAGFIYSRFAVCDVSLRESGVTSGGPLPPGRTAIIDGPVGAVRSFRRSVYDRTAGLDATMLYAEDRDLVYKLEELVVPVFIDEVLYRYRVVPGSQSNDPHKHRIGIRNCRRARQAALRRRGVLGLGRIAWEAWIAADLVASDARTPRFMRFLTSGAAAGLARLLRSGRFTTSPRSGRRPEQS